MKLLRWTVVLFALLAWTVPARAQAGETAVIRRELARRCPGAEVRLALASADTLRGYCGFVEDRRLTVRWMTEARDVPLEQVEALWIRTRGTGTGARTGAILGGLGLATFGFIVGNGLCDDTAGCGSDTAYLAGAGGVLGALAGAGIGALIGHNVHAWDQRYPTPRR